MGGIHCPHSLFYYDTGVFNVPECLHNQTTIGHAVTLVGFGTDQYGTDYYNIRNSWSTNWGDKGHIKIVRGDYDCSIASTPGYAEIATDVANTVEHPITIFS